MNTTPTHAPTPEREVEYWRDRFEAARAQMAADQRTIAELRALVQQAYEDKDAPWTSGWKLASEAALERSKP